MATSTILGTFFLIVSIFGIGMLWFYIFYSYIYPKYKRDTVRLSFSECKNILLEIILMHFDVYDNTIFSGETQLTNSSYENYYTDLTTTIRESLSENYLMQIETYITVGYISDYISIAVDNYLKSKINIHEAILDSQIKDDDDD